MATHVRRAPNAGPIRIDHWFAAAVVAALIVAAAWAALAAGAEVGALIASRGTVDLRDPGAAFTPLLHPRAPGATWTGSSATHAPAPALFWAIATVVFVVLAVPALRLGMRIARWIAPADRYKGQASAAHLTATAGVPAVQARASRVRPSLMDRRLPTTEVAIRIGESARDGAPVWMSMENNLGLVAGPQTGKTTSTMGVIPLLFPGPAIMTETHRPDVMAMSACQPGLDRPVLVLDPENRVGWPDPIGVDVLRGCEDHAVARRRAELLIRGATTRSEVVSSNMEFFMGEATTAATAFLHAARISNLGLDAVLRWTNGWGSEQPVEILEGERSSAEAQSDAQMLRQLYAVTGPQVAGTTGELRNTFACLANPEVVRTFSGGHGRSLDIGEFLDERARLYIHGSGREQRSIAPFVALVISEIVEEALRRAATAPARRLDPPLLLDLDEVANIAPLPELPYYLSAGTGSGIVTAWAAQGRAQLRKRWGPDAAREIWQSTNFRVWFGGSVEHDDLRELQDLSGDVWEETLSEQRPEWTEWLLSSRNWERYGRHLGVQRVPVFTAEQLRTLPDGHAVLFARNLPVTQLRMRPWWERRDIATLVRESIRAFDARIADSRAG